MRPVAVTAWLGSVVFAVYAAFSFGRAFSERVVGDGGLPARQYQASLLDRGELEAGALQALASLSFVAAGCWLWQRSARAGAADGPLRESPLSHVVDSQSGLLMKEFEPAPSAEVEVRRADIDALVAIFVPDAEYRPLFCSDEASVFDITCEQEEELSKRLAARLGGTLRIDLRQPLWRVVDQINASSPGWRE